MVFDAVRVWLDHCYPPTPPPFTGADVPPGSQSGQVFIVTGGNGGIGFELCKILYGSGATIYLAARSKERALAAIKAIAGSTDPAPGPQGALKYLPFDLMDLESVQAAAKQFAAQETRLDVLWNNAGVGVNGVQIGQRTAQGLEPHMGMHCVAALLFTLLLLPQLRAAVAAERAANGDVAGGGRTRVVWVSSGMAETHTPWDGIAWDALDRGRDRVFNYAHSKAGVWLLAREMTRRHGAEGIVSIPVNPGNVRAGVWGGFGALATWFYNTALLYDTVLGAYTELYCGLSSDLTLENNGIYVIPWGRLRPDEEVVYRKDLINALTPVEEGGLGYAARLWEWCEDGFKPYLKTT